jgi:transcriptional regulator with XRE-family HTH domain
MDQTPDIQKALFDRIRELLPSSTSFVHEIADLLGISYDSAYRRIRGEKTLSMEELYKISNKYRISLDALFGVQANSIIFDYFTLEPDKLGLKEWLTLI